jgi:hypothetical protein
VTILKGHFDGKQIVLDEPVPPGIEANAPVIVHFTLNEARGILKEIVKRARPAGLPADFSEQHDHYVKGLPRR